MIIELSRLLEADGRSESIDYKPGFSSVEVSGESFPAVPASEVKVHIVNTGRKVLEITAGGEFQVVIPCARCLESVTVSVPVNAFAEADMKLSDAERRSLEEPVLCITGTSLDADMLIRDEILTNWPIRVLCREDCKGLCSHCGANLNVTKCDCKEEAYDPRMAAILDIFNNNK